MSSSRSAATTPPPGATATSHTSSTTCTRPKSLMETLLVAKMEQVTIGCHVKQLVRTDSADSASSLGSLTSVASDVCRCDDCLLGIVDLYAQESADGNKPKKKVGKGGKLSHKKN